MEPKKKYTHKKDACPKCGQPKLTTAAFCRHCTPKAPPANLERNMAIFEATKTKTYAEVAVQYGLTRQRVAVIVTQMKNYIEKMDGENDNDRTAASERNNQ